MITRKNIHLVKGGGFSYGDFPYLARNEGHDLGKSVYDIYIGKWRVAQILECNNGKYVMSNTYSTYKSIHGATAALLRRLNA